MINVLLAIAMQPYDIALSLVCGWSNSGRDTVTIDYQKILGDLKLEWEQEQKQKQKKNGNNEIIKTYQAPKQSGMSQLFHGYDRN